MKKEKNTETEPKIGDLLETHRGEMCIVLQEAMYDGISFESIIYNIYYIESAIFSYAYMETLIEWKHRQS